MRRMRCRGLQLAMTFLHLLLRCGLALLFGLAGAAKLSNTTAFAEEIANYRLLPALAPLLAVTLPTIEIATALALAFAPRAWRAGAALLALLLLVAFTIAVTAAWIRGIDVACGCFGA